MPCFIENGAHKDFGLLVKMMKEVEFICQILKKSEKVLQMKACHEIIFLPFLKCRIPEGIQYAHILTLC